MKFRVLIILALIQLQSCVSKKDVLYLQDANTIDASAVSFSETRIQANDILKINIGSLVPEAAVPYNKVSSGMVQATSIDIMKLEGYVVSQEQSIQLPILGVISVANKTTDQLAAHIKTLLEEGGHLSNPTVDIRLLNAKFTVLGEVNSPGTFNYTETNINLLQALGYAGDLSINGKRDDVLVIRELDGTRKISHINLNSSAWLTSDAYQIKPNDVIIVNPNTRVIKGSGVVDTGTFLALASLTLSVIILLTR
ncbi:polysaccharide biosynthesis/export family protein [Algibacter sp.]|uniref:polysaccharide biosynthesis/export family protein n=1 Tax=Algibacter sp. TaxID=1872428 RepID=UPI003C74C3C2